MTFFKTTAFKKTARVAIASALNERFRRWADQRSPRAGRVMLDQRRIYILPSLSGLVWLVMVTLVFLLAANYSNSLAYGLSFFMLSLFMLSILYTWRNLAGVSLIAQGGKAGFAGERVEVNVECQATGRPRVGLTIGWPGSEQAVVSFNQAQEQSLRVQAEHRGWLKPERMLVASVYPLGLCRAWSWVRLNFQCLVYPRPDFSCPLPESVSESGDSRCCSEPGFDDFSGFRRYRDNDNPVHIDWRGYARTGELHSKQFDQPAGTELLFSLNQVPLNGLEQKLSVITGWCLLCEQAGRPYGLILNEGTCSPSLGAGHLQKCLEALALYTEQPGSPQSQGSVWNKRPARAVGRGDD